MKLGIIGATGAVGKVFLNLLPSSNLNITDLRLSASSRSIGKRSTIKTKSILFKKIQMTFIPD